MKILTIVVPVYNTEDYIRRCLDFILIDEILDDIEVILVNDGSKDNSLKILNEYQKNFSNTVIVIDKENGGHGSVINLGLERATGKYFRVIDSDDWVNSVDFVKCINKLKLEDVDLVVTNYRKEYIYIEESEYLQYKKLKEKTYNFDEFNIKDLEGNYFTMSTSIYKTEVLRRSGLKLLENTFYVDMQYNIVPTKEINTFKFIDLDIYRYFIGRKNQSMNMQNFVKNQKHHETVMKNLVEFYKNNMDKCSENHKEYVKKIINYMLYTHYCIYCIYDKENRKNAYKSIKNFDEYLKNIDKELYDIQGINKLIRYNRYLHFIPVRINGLFFLNSMNIFYAFLRKIGVHK